MCKMEIRTMHYNSDNNDKCCTTLTSYMNTKQRLHQKYKGQRQCQYNMQVIYTQVQAILWYISLSLLLYLGRLTSQLSIAIAITIIDIISSSQRSSNQRYSVFKRVGSYNLQDYKLQAIYSAKRLKQQRIRSATSCTIM